MSKLNQTKLPIQLEDLAEIVAVTPKYRLVRERDGLTKQSEDVIWLEFNEEERFKEKHTEPSIGRSLIMSPFNAFFTWQTTAVTEIVEQREDYIKFKTQNSNYELFKI